MSDFERIKEFLAHIQHHTITKDARDAATIAIILSDTLERTLEKSHCLCLNGYCPWHEAKEAIKNIELCVAETRKIPMPYDDDGN